MIQSASTQPTQRGVTLYQLCKADVRAVDSSGPPTVDNIEGKVCEAYILGFIDGVVVGDKTICVNGATPETLARVYVTWMENHPKLMDEPKRAGLYQALAVEYPCSALVGPRDKP